MTILVVALTMAARDAGAIVPPLAIRVVVNGEVIRFERLPIIRQGRILVPFREILRPLQISGSVEGDTAYAQGGPKPYPAVILHAGRSQAYVVVGDRDCRTSVLDVAPTRQKGTYMVPLRYVAESTGVQVYWDRTTRTVLLTYEKDRPPEVIHPPTPVESLRVRGDWQVEPSTVGPLVCATCNEFPLTLGLSPGRARPGPRIELSVGFTNLAREVVTITRAVTLRIRIAQDGGCPVIWEGILPPIEGPIAPGSAHFRFIWDQRDARGRPVAKGTYVAQIVFPVTIAYSMDGTAAEERLTSVSGHKLGGEIDSWEIHVP